MQLLFMCILYGDFRPMPIFQLQIQQITYTNIDPYKQHMHVVPLPL